MRLAVLGGGAYVPKMCDVLADAVPGPVSVTLAARDADRLAAVARHAAARVAARGWTVRGTTDTGTALDGADVVVLLVRVGGLAARAHDEAFPRRFGLAGDEGLGPGGIANAWRTVPWLSAIAPRLRGARVLNLMAPLGITTRVLLDGGVDAVGLCELPLVTLRAHGATSFRYGGLNHLGWFWDMPGRPGVHPLKYLERVFAPASLPPAGRAEALRALSDRLVAAFAAGDAPPAAEAERPTPWFDDALAPFLAARAGGPPWDGFVNVANDGLLPELPGDAVVEVAARVSAQGARPVAPGPLPAEIVPFLQAVARADALALAAARARDPRLVAEAMAALPLPIGDAEGLAREAIREVS